MSELDKTIEELEAEVQSEAWKRFRTGRTY